MHLEHDDFYFFSTEGYSTDLPIKARFVKRLATNNDREAILIKCEKKIKTYGTEYFVLVPRHQGMSFYDLGNNEQIFAHVLDGRNKSTETSIDLSGGSKLIIDIGGISFDAKVADRWQPKKQ